MRHRFFTALTVVAGLVSVGCDGGGSSGQGPEPTPSSPPSAAVVRDVPQLAGSEQFALERDISGARDVTGAQSTLYRLIRE